MAPPSSPPILLEKEIRVLRLVAQGLDNQEIARTLGESEHTVSNRLRSVFRKIRVTNRTQAALYALRHGLASLDDPKV
jgi:DNA-binding NarL/FixJ family response regulator